MIKVYYVKQTYAYRVEYYYENLSGEFELAEPETEPGTANYQDTITTYEPKDQNGNYVLSHVTPADENGNAYLVISEVAENNVIKVYYLRNTFDYKVEYYKNSVNTANKLGETDAKEQKLGTEMTFDIVVADFGTEWLNAHKPQVGYQDGTVVEYITIQANDNNVIQVVYASRTDIEYSVEYYFNNEIDTTGKNYTETATFGEKITLEDITDYSNNGEWTLESSNLPFEIVAVTGNVIKVYYVKPDITVEKTRTVNTNRTTGVANTVEPGETITYTITATNTGYKEGTVTIADTVPTGTTLNGDILVTGYTKSTITADELAEGIVLTVPAQGTATITFTVTVTANVNNNIVNIPTVNGTEDTENTVTNPVEKTVSVKAKSDNSTITNSNIVIVLDTSGSMEYDTNEASDRECECWTDYGHELRGCINVNGTWYEPKERIEVAQAVVNGFIDNMNLPAEYDVESCAVTVIEFNYAENATVVGTADTSGEAATLKTSILALNADGGTEMAAALNKAKTELQALAAARPNNKNIVIFVSDGDNEDSDAGIITAAASLKNASINPDGIANSGDEKALNPTVYTVAFGSDISILEDTIATSANTYYTTGTSGSLSNIFSEMNADITGTPVPTQSEDGLIELIGIYADDEHPIKITVNGTALDDITTLPTDDSGKVILKDGTYYLDLSKFNATDSVSIEYFAE